MNMQSQKKQWMSVKFKNFVQLQRSFNLPQQNRKKVKYPIVASTSIAAYHDDYKVKALCVDHR